MGRLSEVFYYAHLHIIYAIVRARVCANVLTRVLSAIVWTWKASKTQLTLPSSITLWLRLIRFSVPIFYASSSVISRIIAVNIYSFIFPHHFSLVSLSIRLSLCIHRVPTNSRLIKEKLLM